RALRDQRRREHVFRGKRRRAGAPEPRCGALGGQRRARGLLTMSPDQFLARMKKGAIAPAYLFLGTEAYGRDRCRQALLDAMLPPAEREDGLARYDLRESSLVDV